MPHPMIEPALTLLTSNYIFPDKAATIAAAVRERDAAGDYDGLDEPTLGERVTALFDELSGDKHLRLRPTANPGAETPAEADIIAAWEAHLTRTNHGVAEVRRLPGNVGLISLTNISSPESGSAVIAAAMTLVANTHALIFDNRQNRGGSPEGVQLWHSHLFPDGDTHLNDIFTGGTGVTRQYWTLPAVPGPRYHDRPVWNLTSSTTFSAGEEFSYNLKTLKRATLVGETTRGGAHPTEVFPLSATFEITIPIARSINPVTGTNWEGTGVVPDIAVPADDAFGVAYKAALEHVIAGDPHPATLAEAKEALAGL
ncbi:S41 family peptidase [Phytomonospora endophytica]|uniref:C-terminal processing protease CtpA/Prc n=1 Tax=Phytomonospora endophytica TaxID=714109 RepID=A0A841FKN3_9ACTN|nr:S41 family peptidase [Phytomonospora endophytica]MBB6036424.1 C-terminal processing protease CtpA/Prc [Phytomonospora endophytica]GIG65747.1 interphotoreceptor retinoid-binding protein [Phytomonospora endophytica]